jgi:hypothetical protein
MKVLLSKEEHENLLKRAAHAKTEYFPNEKDERRILNWALSTDILLARVEDVVISVEQ